MLELQDVSFRYGALTVTDKVSLALERGSSLGIIGPNGAGKSTLLDLLMGTKHPVSGTVLLDGNDISLMSARKRATLGIARAYQVPRPFKGMTVFENLLVGATLGGRKSEAETYDKCFNILEQTDLIDKAQEQANSLRLLDRKRLEMARAIATNPDFLLLDEVAGGLTELECEKLIETILEVLRSGVAIIWIEHVVHALVAVVEQLCMIDQGKLIVQGTPESVLNDSKVKEVYMGTPV